MIAFLHELCIYQHQKGDHKVACTRTTIMFLIKNSDRDEDLQGESGLATQAVVRPKKPNLYQVVLLNDDYTPMEFVVELIEEFFYKSRDVATRIMLKVHTEGKGVCGVYTQDVAETKVALVNQHAQDSQHPLMCQAEPVDNGDKD